MTSTFFSFIQRYFFSLFIIFTGIAIVFPHFFIWGKSFAPYFLMLVLYCSFLRIDFSNIHISLHHIIKPIIFSILSLIAFPIIIFTLTQEFSIEAQIGFFLIFGMSAGMANPMLANLFQLHIFEATLFTIISSFIVPFTLPFLIHLFFNVSINFPIIEMFLFLGKIIFLPFIFAIISKYFLSSIIQTQSAIIGGTSSVLMLMYIAFLLSPYSQDFWNLFSTFNTILIFITVFILWIGKFIFGYLLPAKNSKEKWTNAMNLGNMNIGISLLISSSFFGNETITILLIGQIIWIFIQILFKKILSYFVVL